MFLGVSRGLTIYGYRTVGGGAPPPAPPTSGLVARYRADLGVTDAGGGAVSAWADQSGNGYDLAQATSALRPTVVTNVVNGHPVIRFVRTSATKLGRAATPVVPQPYMVVAVARANAGAEGFGDGVFTDSSDADQSIMFFHDTSNGLGLFTWNGPALNGTSVLGAMHLIGGAFNGASSVAYVDGSAGAPANVPNYGLEGLSIGADFGGAFPLDGDIAEVLVYDHVLDAAEQATLAAYVLSRYNL